MARHSSSQARPARGAQGWMGASASQEQEEMAPGSADGQETTMDDVQAQSASMPGSHEERQQGLQVIPRPRGAPRAASRVGRACRRRALPASGAGSTGARTGAGGGDGV